MIGLGAIVMCLLATTSCKKDYTCTCSNNGATYGTAATYTKVKKKDAEKTCSDTQTAANNAGFSGVSCKIN